MLVLYAITLCVSSFLVFLVQPMVGKAILPLYGGTPAIWNSCMLFFQIILLAGYAYAHFSLKKLSLTRQPIVHLILLLAAFLILPITIGVDSVPPPEVSPPLFLLYKLFLAAGLPFFLVSSTGPLLQRWFMGTNHPSAKDPYFLYSASNIGSLVALIGYPLLFEPGLSLSDQSSLWSWSYGLLLLLMVICALPLLRQSKQVGSDQKKKSPPAEEKVPLTKNSPTWRIRLYWLFAAFIPSSLMLGATAHITTNVAVLPLFWVLPLAIYLLTFILTFASKPPIPHRWMTRLLPLIVLPLGAMIFLKIPDMEWLAVPCHLFLFFVVSMVCHGELVRTRPPGRHLTGFYLWMATGGMLGGLFNALLAPVIFSRVIEYPLVVALACLLLPAKSKNRKPKWMDFAIPIFLAFGTGVLILALNSANLDGSRTGLIVLFIVPAFITFCFYEQPIRFALSLIVVFAAVGYAAEIQEGTTQHITRNFFGVKRVVMDNRGEIRKLAHGATVHGGQFIDPERGRHAISYYHRTGPVGDIFLALAQNQGKKRIGVVGLGVGLAAGYFTESRRFTFYEVDQQVDDIAQNPEYFTYLENCGENCEVVIGDGRLAIQESEDRSFDLILLDAFNSGTIPLHLLTVEAIQTYLKKLRSSGILAFHISNRFVDLSPPLNKIANQLEVTCITRKDLDEFYGKEPCHFLVMGRSNLSFDWLEQHPYWELVSQSKAPLWTDQKSNLLSALKW